MIRRLRTVVLCAALLLAGTAVPAGADERQTLRPGMRGPAVVKLQRRLAALHYVPGAFDGRYEGHTVTAVWAFQKVNGLPATGLIGRRTWRALDHPRRPRRLARHAPRDRVEIDLTRQLLVIYQRRRVALISHISTGTGRHYCDGGHCGVAVTPTGTFRVYRKIRYWHRSPLGLMYDSVFYHGGYSMHGSLQVPPYPASHGCVRLPMPAAERMFRLVRKGEPVYVRRPRR